MELEIVKSTDGKLIDRNGKEVIIPRKWSFFPAGDAGVTRAITKQKNYIRVKELRGRRAISKGIWAPEELIQEAKQRMTKVRSSDIYRKQKLQREMRRDQIQEAFIESLEHAIRDRLSFHNCYKELEESLAKAIVDHSSPIGSGTVSRSSRLSIETKAEKAINGWVRHHLTPYEQLKIARTKGARRLARKMMIDKGNEVLVVYRKGQECPNPCPIHKSLNSLSRKCTK
ncbi:DUF2293 domain-containing protein [Prolixibacteraceae bacterium]|nr:DUF2293 domain-containing protein [Prolixibacteraceae bacterium]